MPASFQPWQAAVWAFVTSLVLTPVVRAAARRWGFLDRPNERSSHSRVTPRAGGIAIVLTAIAVLGLQPDLWRARDEVVAFLAALVVLAATGLWDDRFGLSPLVRFGVQIAVAAGFVSVAGAIERLPFPSPLDLPLGSLAGAVTVVWIVAVVNFFNFMDGIDGIAGVQALVAGAGLALAELDPFVSVAGATLAAAAAGFLVYNWSPASVFLGDTGSYGLGFSFAALPLLSTEAPRAAAVWFAALSLWFFLADASFTLLRRLSRGERVHMPHREHLYQRLVIAGLSHHQVALAIGVASAVVTTLAVLVLRESRLRLAWPLFALGLVLFVAEVWLARRIGPGTSARG